MANYNLTNQEISSSFQQLMQYDRDTGSLYDGTGSLIENIEVTSSFATTASYAINHDDPTWDEIQNKPDGIVSGSSQIVAEDTTGTFPGSRIDGAVVSASYASNGGVTSIIAGNNINIDQGTGDVTISSTTTASADWNNLTNKPDGIVSGSSQIILQSTTGDLSGSRIDGQVSSALSSSHAEFADTLLGTIESASYAISASYAEFATTSSFALNFNPSATASYALFSEEAENAEHADAVQFPVIAKETLTKGDPVYVSGYNSGEGKPEVLKADASDSSKMPVVGLAMVNASNNDHIFIAVAGNFSDVDTDTGLTSPSVGDTLYVASGGGYTNVKPTGTNLIQNIGVIGRVQQNNGEIVVSAIQRSNDLPNIQDGYTWVGDGSGVPQAVATSSFAGATIDTGSFATTGSNVFVGDQTISGSTLTEVNTQGITSLTASVDFSDTSLFELTLGSGVDTHIDASNIGRGQTINVLITQDATSAGTLSFSPKFLQPSGSEYTATTTLSGQDILTFITYNDTSKVYVVATNKFE